MAAEFDNLRAALGWALERGTVERSALGEFWFLEGYASEGRLWVERLLHLAGEGMEGAAAMIGPDRPRQEACLGMSAVRVAAVRVATRSQSRS